MPTFDTPEPITAVLDVVLADVRIGAGDRGTTTVEVHPSDAADAEDVRAAELTRVEYADRRLVVRAPKLRSWLNRGGGGSIDVTIELPAGSHVQGAGSAADFRCDGPLGDCRIKIGLGAVHVGDAATLSLKSGSGDIEVEHVGGHADVITGSGDVRLRDLGATAVVKNSNGDTWIGEAAGDLRVSAANGSIAVGRPHASVVAKSANGDVRLAEVERGSVVLETHVGDLEVGIREGTAAWLDVSAAAGKLHNALEAADAPTAATETVEVRARTSLGDIVIRRP
jgi:Putative adhesin